MAGLMKVDPLSPGPVTDHSIHKTIQLPSRPLDYLEESAFNNAFDVKNQLQSGQNVEKSQLKILKATRSPRD